MKPLTSLTLALSCSVALGLGSHLAMAQESADDLNAQDAQGETSTMQAPSTAETIEVSDSQLALYLQAATKVEEIRQGIQEQMPEAGSAEEAQTLQEEAMQQMVAAVESFGMTVDEYNRIAIAVQQDPQLQSRLRELM